MKLIFHDYFQLKTQKTFDYIERASNAKMKIGFLIISALQVILKLESSMRLGHNV